MRKTEALLLVNQLSSITEEEWQAIEHVREYGLQHSLNGCPRNFGQICPYRNVIVSLESRLPLDLCNKLMGRELMVHINA